MRSSCGARGRRGCDERVQERERSGVLGGHVFADLGSVVTAVSNGRAPGGQITAWNGTDAKEQLPTLRVFVLE